MDKDFNKENMPPMDFSQIPINSSRHDSRRAFRELDQQANLNGVDQHMVHLERLDVLSRSLVVQQRELIERLRQYVDRARMERRQRIEEQNLIAEDDEIMENRQDDQNGGIGQSN